MTSDFIDDAIDALNEEGFSYMIILQPKNGKSARVLGDLEEWKTGKQGVGVREDIHQLLNATVFRERN